MNNKSICDAKIPNPALKQFGRFVGEWKTVGSHPLLLDKVLNGKSSFKWIEGGAFLIWYSQINEEHFPGSVAVFGSDNTTGELFMLYFDSREVSRKYDVSFEDNVLKWWRNAPGFSQRCSWIFTDNANKMIGKGNLFKDDKNWEKIWTDIYAHKIKKQTTSATENNLATDKLRIS